MRAARPEGKRVQTLYKPRAYWDRAVGRLKGGGGGGGGPRQIFLEGQI